MTPSGKSNPGWWDLVTAGVMPELSVAVGSVQVTIIDVLPIGVTMLMGPGQLLTTGGVVSCPSTALKENGHKKVLVVISHELHEPLKDNLYIKKQKLKSHYFDRINTGGSEYH